MNIDTQHDLVTQATNRLDVRENVTVNVSTGTWFGNPDGVYLQFAYFTGKCCPTGTVTGIPWTVVDNTGGGEYSSQCSACGAHGSAYVMSDVLNTSGGLADTPADREQVMDDWVRAAYEAFSAKVDAWITDTCTRLEEQLDRELAELVATYKRGLACNWAYDPDVHDPDELE